MLDLFLPALIAFIVWELFVFYRRKSTLPPGPFAVPFLGNFINEVMMSLYLTMDVFARLS